jgi:hypothetical protein
VARSCEDSIDCQSLKKSITTSSITTTKTYYNRPAFTFDNKKGNIRITKNCGAFA